MANQVIIWAALPAGTSGGKLRVSVHMAPRLQDGSTLSDFPDFLDWPATKIAWAIRVNGVNHPATVVGVRGKSALWKQVFSATTPITSYVYANMLPHRFFTYPAAFVRSFLVSAYSQLAFKSPLGHPLRDYLLADSFFSLLPKDDEQAASLERELLAKFPTGGGPIPPAGRPSPGLDLTQARMFLRPLTIPPKGVTSKTVKRPPVPNFDFHQALSLLARHPALLRLFGVVVDLEIDRPSGKFGSTVSVQAVPMWSSRLGGSSGDVMPETITTWTSWLPAPRAAEPEVSDGGLLRLSDPNAYQVVEADLDGATLKALDFVLNVTRAGAPSLKSADTPVTFASPSLRSAGLSLARNQSATTLYGHLQNSGTLNSGLVPGQQPVSLNAEDIIQGYRIDVWDSRRDHWFPLCRRIAAPHPGPGGYAIGKPPVIEPVPGGDEGWVELGLASAGDQSSTDQYLPETLLRWAGWSLVAPRPGKHLAADPHDGIQSDQHNPATGTFPLQIDYAAAPGTLPVLRFGRAYRFRARAVDIAGNSAGFSPSVAASAFEFATPNAQYGRLEPVASPVLIPMARRTPGEHLERLVIRSNYDIPDSSKSIVPCSRHVSPPSSSEELAEQHGAFDNAHGRPDPATYAEIAGRDGKSYASHDVVTALGGKYDKQPMNAGQQWLYYPGDHLEVPYLPDIFSRGVTFAGLPGHPALLQAPYGEHDKWPAAHSLRLVIEPGSGPPKLTPGAQGATLTVKLPKGTIAPIRISSHLNPADVGDLTLWEWLRPVLPSGQVGAFLKFIAEGAHWMFTPFREIVLVHAVRQPLEAPRYTILSPARNLSWTYCLLSGQIEADPRTSQRLDVIGQWTEPYDDGRNPKGAVELNGRARVGELHLQPSHPKSVGFADLRHEFGDTKHRVVFYEAVATSRFLEYFTETSSAKLTGTSPVTVSGQGFAPGATTVRHGTVTYRAGQDYTENDAKGTIARIAGGSIPDSQIVEVTYVAPPVTRSSLEAAAHPPTKAGRPLSIPSSARPAAPDVRYVIPAFEWLGVSHPQQIESRRIGNLLRVYLGRPWWSSGAGERLGIVLWVPPKPGIRGFPPPNPGLVTQYGPDPIVIGGPVKTTPKLADYPLADAAGHALHLAEQPPIEVNVAGHSVSFDADRGLWFADIAVNAGAGYWPFVRLALVRYQPSSLAGVEISRVTHADFAQLAPDRVATVTFPSKTSAQVSVTGPGYSKGPQGGAGDEMVVYAETQQPHVTDPELRWQLLPATGTLLNSVTGPDGITTWSGIVKLPAAHGSKPMRLLIVESENVPAADANDSNTLIKYFDAIPI